MIQSIQKSDESAIRYACELAGVKYSIYTNEEREGMLTLDANITPEESWFIATQAQLKLREETLQRIADANDDSLFNLFKIKF